MPDGSAISGTRTGRLRRQLKPALDLTDFFGVLIDRFLIPSAEIFLQALQFRQQRIQNAAALTHARRANFRSGAAAEQAFEHDLRIEFHRKRRDAWTSLPRSSRPDRHEIEFVYEQL